MIKKIAICAGGASVLLFTGWFQTGKHQPQPAHAPSGFVQQSISRTTFVKEANLENTTLLTMDKSKFPTGLTFVCHLYAEAPQGGLATDQPGKCALPYGAKIDTSHKTFSTFCSGGGATTNMTEADVPLGIVLACDGDYYWAVLAPVKLEALQFDATGTVTQWGVNIHQLYCGPGGAPNGGCNVKLDVYAWLKP